MINEFLSTYFCSKTRESGFIHPIGTHQYNFFCMHSYPSFPIKSTYKCNLLKIRYGFFQGNQLIGINRDTQLIAN